jgi:hypothetical protein
MAGNRHKKTGAGQACSSFVSFSQRTGACAARPLQVHRIDKARRGGVVDLQ